MRQPLLLIAATALLTGCGPFWNAKSPAPTPLPTADARRELTGRWRLVLTLPQRAVSGTFEITDSLVGQRQTAQLATLSPSFPTLMESSGPTTMAITGPMPLAVGGRAIDVSRTQDAWIINLTPSTHDYAVVLSGALTGDSMSGAWSEESWGRVLNAGTFVMRRVPPR